MLVPHDPAHAARLTYVWRDERWHLLDNPPTVVLVSDTTSQGSEYPSVAAAERAFWRGVVDSILTQTDRIASITTPRAEIAVVLDKRSRAAHLVERTKSTCLATTFAEPADSLSAWRQRARELISTCEHVA
ncbi:hypothetical protein Misp01_52380 [Microtetraspora sp. NBRC 13810]|uniref:hypothetical protein n=1 Tax=Microtetraspora sp. NBRC 13810 TaxID=3030990 RepID=UPI0025554560|nr:hypothetical protein [Microtetraspora sp. NBRC 13810]GLW10109.1 hypothetical protein Misp01_52380 [Microtetraspora sp. NBRC 13810]